MAFAITNIGTNIGAGTTTTVTVGVGGVPSGSVIFCGIYENSNNPPGGSVTDSQSNTYASIVKASLNNVQANGFGNTFYAFNATALVNGNTIVYHCVGVGAGLSCCYITGADTAAPLDTAVSASAFGSSTTPSVTGGAPGATDIQIGWLAEQSSANVGTVTQASGWSSPPNAFDDAANIGGFGGNQVSGSALTYNPTMQFTGPWAIFIVAFKPAAAGGAPPQGWYKQWEPPDFGVKQVMYG